MDGAFGSHKRRRRLTINITSLVDVMFLMIIFLLVTTTFQDRLGIEIALPSAQTGQQQPQQNNYMISVSRLGTILFGPQNAAPREISSDELRAAIENIVRTQPESSLLLQADSHAPFKDAVSVIDIARQAGGKQLVILTQPADAPAPPETPAP